MAKKAPDEQGEPVFNLEDLIEARDERVLASADDVDVDDALTFPHPHKQPQVDALDMPNKDDVGFDYQDSIEEALPTDYAEPYADALSTELADNEVVAEKQLHELGELTPADLADSLEIEPPDEGDIGDLPDDADQS